MKKKIFSFLDAERRKGRRKRFLSCLFSCSQTQKLWTHQIFWWSPNRCSYLSSILPLLLLSCRITVCLLFFCFSHFMLHFVFAGHTADHLQRALLCWDTQTCRVLFTCAPTSTEHHLVKCSLRNSLTAERVWGHFQDFSLSSRSSSNSCDITEPPTQRQRWSAERFCRFVSAGRPAGGKSHPSAALMHSAPICQDTTWQQHNAHDQTEETPSDGRDVWGSESLHVLQRSSQPQF